jgi:oligopeptide transport system ATP-binding protein
MTATFPARLSPPEVSLLTATDIVKDFSLSVGHWLTVKKRLRAVDHVSFDVQRGETLGIVGESGCGKTTLARILVGLERPTTGSVLLAGEPLFVDGSAAFRRSSRIMQMVFQDPYNSLDPHMTVGQLVAEPWEIHDDVVPGRSRRAQAAKVLQQVGLDPSDMDKLATTFSGGQRQRIGIARALALSPRLLVLDEPVSALDVSIQAQIIELLRDLQENLGLAMIFIGHDLAVVRSLAHRVAVMYLGRIVELGPADDVYERPTHPYTRALISAAPAFGSGGRSRIKLQGEVPSPIDPPSGCRFHPRCWLRDSLGQPNICKEIDPPLVLRSDQRTVACHFADVPANAIS